jgi:hypothetical protein
MWGVQAKGVYVTVDAIQTAHGTMGHSAPTLETHEATLKNTHTV